MKDAAGTWWSGYRQARRPVSRRRRRIGLALLILLVAGLVAYRSLTSEARLGRFAERWLEDFSGGEARIDEVRFDLFNGLHLVGVSLAVPASAGFDSRDDSLEARTVFRSAALFLRLRPLSIISGNLVVPEIVAVDPELTLVHRTSDGRGNWEAMFERRKARAGWERPSRLPVVHLRNARLTQYRLDERGRSGGPPQIIYAEARPQTGNPEVYHVAITKLVTSPDSREMVGRLEIDMNTLAVSGSLPVMRIKEFLFAAPPEIRHWLEDVLGLSGYVRPDSLSYDPRSRGQASLTLRDASVSIPLTGDEAGVEPARRYVRLEEVGGSIRFDGSRAEVALAGRFQNSPLKAKGTLVLPAREVEGLEGIGFDLELNISDVPLPREDETADPSEVRFVHRWERLRKFVRDYDGTGKVDLTLRLEREPRADAAVKFVEAILTPRGASGRYWRFPYRLYGLTGTVHFRRDGWVELEDLTGTHGTGRVVINGLVGGYVSKEVRLDIRAANVELDEDLLECLLEQDRVLCRRLQAEARMDLHVQLQREDYASGSEPKPWQSVIDVTFTDGSVSYVNFPYPLEQLRGRMQIAAGGFRIDALQASRGRATVRVSGSARRSGGQGASLDLALQASDVALDEVLARALPGEIRERYDRLNPAGRLELTGRLFTRPGSQRVEYDLTAAVTDGCFDLPGTSARLSGATATVRLVPSHLEIESLHGKFGESDVELRGRVGMEPGALGVSVQVACPRLPLDEATYEALPASLQGTWDSFKPSGAIGLDLRYERATSATARMGPTTRTESAASTVPATQPAEGTDLPARYTVRIEPKDCKAVYAGFPLPLTGINGRLVATPGGVEIEKMTARHGQAELVLTGKVDLLSGQTRVELSVEAHELTFSEPLRHALPWRVQRLWNDVEPRGTFDLSLDKLAICLEPGALATWQFEGRAKLHDVSIAIGTELTEMNGEVTASGEIGQAFSIGGKLDLERVRVDSRLVTEVTAAMSRPAGDPVFRVEDILGRFYGGTIVGRVEVDYSPGGPEYGLSLSARDVSLEKLLNARRKPDDRSVQLKGRVEGNLAVAGRFGDPRSRRGGGRVVIRDAQMFKVPLLLAILQVIHFAIDDDNAFHDGMFSFIVDGDELILEEIDLRGKAFSMVGAGRVRVPTQVMHLVLLVGSPLRLPRVAVLSELLEGVARELMEVHVEGTLDKPTFRTEIVRSVKKTLQTILNMRRKGGQRRQPGP